MRKSFHQLILLTVLLLSSSILLVGCEPDPASLKIKVGVLSGNRYDWQKDIHHGIDLFMQVGRDKEMCQYKKDIELIYLDTQSTQEGASQAARALVHQEKVDVILGPNTSDTVLPAAFVAEAARVPLLSIVSTHSELTTDKSYVFQFVVNNQNQAKALSRYLFNEMKFRKGALIYKLDSDYSRGFSKDFSASFKGLGGEIKSDIGFLQVSNIESEKILQLQRAAPEFILLPLFTENVQQIIERLSPLGLTAKIIGTDSWEMEKLKKLSNLQGALVMDHWVNQTATKELLEFGRENSKIISPLAYDAAKLLWQAICSTPDTNSESIAQFIRNVKNFQGDTGMVESFEQGRALRNLVIVKLEDGQLLSFSQVSVINLVAE